MKLTYALIGLLLGAPAPRGPQLKVYANGASLLTRRPALRLTGPFSCTDNAPNSMDCACPSTGIVVPPIPVTMLMSPVGSADVQALWVTDSTGILCGVTGGASGSASVISQTTGFGFTVQVVTDQPMTGTIYVVCLGALL